jgi:Na+-translocating ferredoxin:NAD+ oxidoreductase subunit B
MNSEDKLYRDLQKHLDAQTLGFPETKSGSDLALLRQLFTPAQAEIALMLTFRYAPVEQIHQRAIEAGKPIEETQRLLDQAADKGIIGYQEKDGIKEYRIIPYVIGILENVIHTATPELISAHVKYSEDELFWKAYQKTKISQMRTIPIQKSITPTHSIGTYDEIRKLVEAAEGPIVVIECACRKGAGNRGEQCKQTSRKETCLHFREMARFLLEKAKVGRQISREEALEILQRNQEDGLVLQPTNSQAPDAICSCCGCCCAPLKTHKSSPNPLSHWSTNFHAAVVTELCTGCGLCEARCQAAAMKLDEDRKIATVALTHCLGCGLCVDACPEGAIELRKNAREVVPPRTMEEMTEVIMTGKR